MHKRRVYLILGVVGLVLVGVLAAVFSREREPEYGGKRLSEWVDELTGSHDGGIALEAVRRIGTNSLPLLVKWMMYETPVWKRRLYDFVNPPLRRLNRSWEFSEDQRTFRALGALVALREVGTNALPFLHEMMNDPKIINRTVASNLVWQVLPREAEAQRPQ